MKQLYVFYVLLISLCLTGCVNLQQEQTLKDVKAQLSELEKRKTETTASLEELNNKFLLLHEQVAINKKGVEEVNAMAVPVAPPEELKVIKLETEKTKGVAKKEPLKKAEAEKRPSVKKTENAPSPEARYNEAQNLFMAGKLSESAEQFNNFIRHFPKHSLADNAQYWIGEVYYSQKDYQKAAVEFQKVVDNYPNENKAPDALLKAAFSNIELNSKERALEALKLVVERYPSSEAAARAKVKLQELQK